jgi:hypothetical protein
MKSKFGKNYIVNQIVAVNGYESYATVEINGIEYAHKNMSHLHPFRPLQCQFGSLVVLNDQRLRAEW